MPDPRFHRGLATLGAVAMLALAGCGSEAATSAAEESTSTPSSGEASTSVSPEQSEPTTDPEASTSGGSSPASATSRDTEGWPTCSQVWIADQELPGRYPGCVEGDVAVAVDRLGCSSGQGMIRFDDRFYAVPGGTIYRADTVLPDDRGYRAAVAICRG